MDGRKRYGPSWLADVSGFSVVTASCRDTKLLFLQRFFRLFAYGATFLILVQFLASLGFSKERIGLFMTLTLLGDAIISAVLAAITDQVGKKRVLAAGAILMVISGVTFSSSDNYWVLTLASILGVISPSGNEVGPFRAIEESILAQLTDKERHSDVFAWYTLAGNAGAALGTALSGWFVQLLRHNALLPERTAYRLVFFGYATLGIVKLILVCKLSSNIELEAIEAAYELFDTDSADEEEGLGSADPSHTARQGPTLWQRIPRLLPNISSSSISLLFRLLLLLCLDSFASGMASLSWLTYFFTTVHSLQPSSLGTLFFVTNILATLSNLAALPLAHSLGPLKTMVFTHLPSAIFLAMVPVPSPGSTGTWLAMMFLAFRACTQSMDQAPRQAFLASAVLPHERTAVLGVVNAVKTLAQAGGTGAAGFLAAGDHWIALLTGAGSMKACYDLLLLFLFVRTR